MSNHCVIYNFRAEIRGSGRQSEVVVNNLTTSSAVAKRPRDARCCYRFCCHSQSLTQQAHKRLVNVHIKFTIAFRIGSECPFIERLVLVKTFSLPLQF